MLGNHILLQNLMISDSVKIGDSLRDVRSRDKRENPNVLQYMSLKSLREERLTGGRMITTVLFSAVLEIQSFK